jgi:hypothetical protein
MQNSFQHKTMLKKFGFWGLNEASEADSVVSADAMRPRNHLWHRGSLRKTDYWLSISLKGYYTKNKYIHKHTGTYSYYKT